MRPNIFALVVLVALIVLTETANGGDCASGQCAAPARAQRSVVINKSVSVTKEITQPVRRVVRGIRLRPRLWVRR